MRNNCSPDVPALENLTVFATVLPAPFFSSVRKRKKLLARLRAGLKRGPAVALLGPRRCGKTTLGRQLSGESQSTYFDLENPIDLARLSEPMTSLESLRGLIVIMVARRLSRELRRLRQSTPGQCYQYQCYSPGARCNRRRPLFPTP